MKKRIKLVFSVAFMLVLGCTLAFPGVAGYRSGEAVQQFKNLEAQTCITPQSSPPLKISLSEADMRDLHLANAYMNYLRGQDQNPNVVKALYRASIKTGVNFELLLLKASMESDMGRFDAAEHSTARGVFQYIEPTWLILMNRYGERVGYPGYARAIQISQREGFPYFMEQDKNMRDEILALRHDDNVAALIKANQITEETGVIAEYKRGKEVTATDHYIAHMLGLKLAKGFYALKNRNIRKPVAYLKNPQIREAVMLNKRFFYKDNKPLSAAQSYVQFEKRVQRELAKIQNVARYNGNPACTYAQAATDVIPSEVMGRKAGHDTAEGSYH